MRLGDGLGRGCVNETGRGPMMRLGRVSVNETGRESVSGSLGVGLGCSVSE